MGLVDHAKKELEVGGYFKKEGIYGDMMGKAVMELMETFAKQGHSGMSAGIVLSIFDSVARYKSLSPLTGEKEEWNEVQPGVFQNNRVSSVFAKDANGRGAYWLDGRTFDGWGNYASKVRIKFPWSQPKTKNYPHWTMSFFRVWNKIQGI